MNSALEFIGTIANENLLSLNFFSTILLVFRSFSIFFGVLIFSTVLRTSCVMLQHGKNRSVLVAVGRVETHEPGDQVRRDPVVPGSLRHMPRGA